MLFPPPPNNTLSAWCVLTVVAVRALSPMMSLRVLEQRCTRTHARTHALTHAPRERSSKVGVVSPRQKCWRERKENCESFSSLFYFLLPSVLSRSLDRELVVGQEDDTSPRVRATDAFCWSALSRHFLRRIPRRLPPPHTQKQNVVSCRHLPGPRGCPHRDGVGGGLVFPFQSGL